YLRDTTLAPACKMMQAESSLCPRIAVKKEGNAGASEKTRSRAYSSQRLGVRAGHQQRLGQRFHHRQFQRDAPAMGRDVFDSEIAPAALGDSVADAQSQARAFAHRLGGVERIERAAEIGEPRARIFHLDHRASPR